MRPSVGVGAFQFIIATLGEESADRYVHQILFLLFREFIADIAQLLDTDQEKDRFHVRSFAKSFYQSGFQVPPSALQVILRLLHTANLRQFGDSCLRLRRFVDGRLILQDNFTKIIDPMEWIKDGFLISTDKGLLDIGYIHQFLSARSYWAKDIPLDVVRRSVDGSECFGIYQGARQVAFARVITDGATFGYLADVFVDEAFRGLGLSKWLMDTILAHPDLQGFRNWMLQTWDAHGLYARSGFEAHRHPDRIMVKTDPDVYKRRK